MIDQNISHHIQKHIVSVLHHQRVARFRDLRKPKTDTNLFAYHLKLLQTQKFIKKVDDGYSLDQKGLAYVDRVSEKDFNVRTQPKIVTMLLIQNSKGEILLQKRDKQPYIDSWTLPYGKLHIDDESLESAAKREAFEKLDIKNQKLTHAGDCYIRVKSDGEILSTTLTHVFTGRAEGVEVSDMLFWVQPNELSSYDLAPAVEKIVAHTQATNAYFFEEFEEAWYN